jgi:hypothetical protein
VDIVLYRRQGEGREGKGREGRKEGKKGGKPPRVEG